MNEEETITKDANGNILTQGDTVISTQNLMAGKEKIQKGTKVKNIRLTDNPEVIEGKIDGSMMVLKTCFFKKVG
jgi:protein PhnA